jgi:hypothetical protein
LCSNDVGCFLPDVIHQISKYYHIICVIQVVSFRLQNSYVLFIIRVWIIWKNAALIRTPFQYDVNEHCILLTVWKVKKHFLWGVFCEMVITFSIVKKCYICEKSSFQHDINKHYGVLVVVEQSLKKARWFSSDVNLICLIYYWSNLYEADDKISKFVCIVHQPSKFKTRSWGRGEHVDMYINFNNCYSEEECFHNVVFIDRVGMKISWIWDFKNRTGKEKTLFSQRIHTDTGNLSLGVEYWIHIQTTCTTSRRHQSLMIINIWIVNDNEFWRLKKKQLHWVNNMVK